MKRAFLAVLIVTLAGCQSYAPPKVSVAHATSLTVAQARSQAKEVMRQVQSRVRNSKERNDPALWEGYIDAPFVIITGICQVGGYSPRKPISFENLTYDYDPSQMRFRLNSVFHDFPGCGDRPRGEMWFGGVHADEAAKLSEALFTLGARPNQ